MTAVTASPAADLHAMVVHGVFHPAHLFAVWEVVRFDRQAFEFRASLIDKERSVIPDHSALSPPAHANVSRPFSTATSRRRRSRRMR
jgi:hypothetical protein